MGHLLIKIMFMLIQAKVSCKWVNDSQHFLLEHFDAIQDSPSHIYHSALPLCPASSWFHDHYSAELSQKVKVLKGLPTGWGTCIRTVSFDSRPLTHTSWKDLIAVSLNSHNIITIDAITGAHLSVLSGHTQGAKSLSFSSDGTLLVSGDRGGTIKLWDIQTAVVAMTFEGHTGTVTSVSISPDQTMIASGSQDKSIRLWNTWTGECCCIIDGHNETVRSVSFSPANSKLLISASDNNTIQWWDINGHKIGPTCEGCSVTISPDGTYFASWANSQPVIVWDSGSRVAIAELQNPGEDCTSCQFSPDSKSVACGVENIIYLWDITSPAPHLIETFVGHSYSINSITFSSYLISSSWDSSVKIWQFGTSSVEQAATDSEPTSLGSVPITSIRLQKNDGIALSFDSAGVVRSWDILTGLCTGSFHTPVEDLTLGDMQLVNNWLILVWYTGVHIYILNTKEGASPLVVDALWKSQFMNPKISGDGSKVFFLADRSIQAWSIQTGELVGEVMFKESRKKVQDFYSHVGDGSRVWVVFEDSQTQGWDFGILDPTPIPLPDVAPDGSHLEFHSQEGDDTRFRIRDKATGNEVFQLSGKYAHPTAIEWDGQYLVAGYTFGGVLILDFNHVLP